jgi:hypothetical protein
VTGPRQNTWISVGGMHPLEAVSLYNGDPEFDAGKDAALKARRMRANARRRAAGIKPFAPSPFGAQNPPCRKCEFHDTCKSKAIACNIFAEWAISRRPVPKEIKRLLPSKKWMDLLSQADTLDPIRVAYYSIINKQTGELK